MMKNNRLRGTMPHGILLQLNLPTSPTNDVYTSSLSPQAQNTAHWDGLVIS